MKKNKVTRLLGVLLGMVMTVSVVGCGSDEAENKVSQQAQESTKTESNSTESSSENNEPETKDKITVAIYDRGTLDPSEGTMEENRWTKWINENAPVEVEFIAIPRWTSEEKYSTLLASNSAPDLILEYSSAILSNMLSNGALMPLDDVIDQYSTEYKALIEKYPAMKKMGTVNGNMYYLTVVGEPSVNHVLVARKDWMDKLGLSIPQTTEDFYAVAEAFAKQDPDGNGKDDTYGYSLSSQSLNQIDFMFGLYQQNDFIQDNNEFIYPWERIAASTQYKKNLFDNGIVSKDFAADTSGEQALQDFISGKLGMIALNNGIETGQPTIENFYENNPEGEVIVLPLPESEFGQNNTAIGTPISTVGAINANCKNPEAVMKYIDWMNSSADIYNTLIYGGEEYSYQDENGKFVIKDSERYAKEVYGTDYTLPVCKGPFGVGQAARVKNNFDPNTDIGAKMLDLYEQAKEYYLGDTIFNREITAALPRPTLTPELSLINSNTYGSSTVADNWTKAILSGDSYTVEQAEADNRKLIEEGGGQQVMDFYTKWYNETSKAGNLVTLDDLSAFIN